MTECKVKIPGDVMQLYDQFFITLERPYWYLRCRACNKRWHLPWDARWRTEDAVQQLVDHGKQHMTSSRSLAPGETMENDARREATTGDDEMDMSKYFGGVFLKVEDIKARGPIRLEIVDVSEGRYDKPDLSFEDGTRLSCNATNGRVLARAYGFDSDDWIDKEVELVVGEIQYQGKPQETVLIKPISPPIENKAPPKRDDPNDHIPF